jgi:cytochrome c oxidase subunit 2
MKKYLLLFASVIVLSVVLSACGAKKEDNAMVAKTPSTTAAPAASDAATSAPANTEQTQEVKLIASAVTFKYDKEEYHVKKDVLVKLTLEMKDGNHGANLADYNVNLNAANPTATFMPDKAGTFLIKCSVPCGDGHMTMTTKLIVE